jgi:type IV pilus assembly protein PilV
MGNARRSVRGAESGEILIEVLIAILILGVGLLGVAAMQATALRNNGSAMQRSQAATQVQTIFEAMRANRTGVLSGDYVTARACAAPSGASLAKVDVANWIGGLQPTLGSSACGTISCAAATSVGIATRTCTATVDWDDSHASNGSSNGMTAGDTTYSINASAQL